MDIMDIKELLTAILRKWWLLLLCAIIGGGIAYYYSNYYLVPMYEANTTMYVGKNVESENLAVTDLTLGSNLIADYREIAKSRQVAAKVIEELNLPMSPAALANRISVTQRSSSRVIQFSIRDSNPQRAGEITNKVAEVFQEKAVELLKIENVQVIDKAELPTYPVSPNKRRYLMIGVAIGIAAALGVVFLIEFLDNTIKTPDDVKKYIDLPVIGTIPAFKSGKGY